MSDIVVRGRDERTHIFRHEKPGVYVHYSRPLWEKFSLELIEDHGREYSYGDIEIWIDALGISPNPITDRELKWVHNAISRGYDGKSAAEPDPDTGNKL